MITHIARSSNGRTDASGAFNLGSNPGLATPISTNLQVNQYVDCYEPSMTSGFNVLKNSDQQQY